jgi:hypothetical protein
MGQGGDARLSLARVWAVGIDQVVVLDVVDRFPRRRKRLGAAEGVAHGVEVDVGGLTDRGRADRAADGLAQPVVHRGIEPEAVGRWRDGGRTVPIPVLGDVDLVSPWMRGEIVPQIARKENSRQDLYEHSGGMASE